MAATQLDTVNPLASQVGYGTLGVRGDLGYEAKRVAVCGRTARNALSAHAPSRILYRLGRNFSTFRCQVALNDDVPAGASYAHFTVLADGREVAHEAYVVAGQSPRTLAADVSGTELLELVVATGRWEWCHAVWVEPELDGRAAPHPSATLMDPLDRAEIVAPVPPPQAARAIATVVTKGFADLLDDLLGSIVANGCCQDALLVVFALGEDPTCARIAAKYRAVLVPCRPRARVNPMSKAILYSVARVIDADAVICLDADMLVLDDLRPVFGAVEAGPEAAIHACREGNGHGLQNLGHALETVYGGQKADFQRLLGTANRESEYPLVVNDGIFAASRGALLALDGAIRGMPEAAKWVDEHAKISWRNQFVFNLALAKLGCGAELSSAYNVQLHVQDVEPAFEGARLRARWRGQNARILHFSGVGRRKYPKWKGHFARVTDPLVGSGHGDNYAVFLDALRAWLGRHGTQALAWSFCGTSDARNARVVDPGVLPLFALLHYMLRSNGCVRVLECGTARGVSTACIASALAHRAGGTVATFDPVVFPERAELWSTLPAAMAQCIDPRQTGSLEGMTAALQANERYDAAFLDSIHTAEHVWAEFDLARQLVCPGGLILVHDACYIGGTVEGALRRIEQAGYGVTRLWTAESGVREDDGLGLAVIENRAGRSGAIP